MQVVQRIRSTSKLNCRTLNRFIITFIFSVLLILAYQFITYEPEFNVTTRPIYLNNTLYNSDTPPIEIDGKLYLPYEEITTNLSTPAFTIHYYSFLHKFTYSGKLESTGELQFVNDNIYCSINFLINTCKYQVNNADQDLSPLYVSSYNQPFDYSWTKNNQMICHALGGLDGHAYLNCKESLMANLNKGFHVFEVDLSLTSDHQLVAIHDWDETTLKNDLGMTWIKNPTNSPLSFYEFSSLKYFGKYTPLSFKNILDIMKENKDMYLILDTKSSDLNLVNASYKEIINELNQYDDSIKKRIIPQTYSEEMFKTIMHYYNFSSMIYSLYLEDSNTFSTTDAISFAYEQGIKVMVMNSSKASDLFTDELTNRGILTYMHTFNLPEDVKNRKEQGVYGFYTDFLSPSGS